MLRLEPRGIIKHALNVPVCQTSPFLSVHYLSQRTISIRSLPLCQTSPSYNSLALSVSFSLRALSLSQLFCISIKTLARIALSLSDLSLLEFSFSELPVLYISLSDVCSLSQLSGSATLISLYVYMYVSA